MKSLPVASSRRKTRHGFGKNGSVSLANGDTTSLVVAVQEKAMQVYNVPSLTELRDPNLRKYGSARLAVMHALLNAVPPLPIRTVCLATGLKCHKNIAYRVAQSVTKLKGVKIAQLQAVEAVVVGRCKANHGPTGLASAPKTSEPATKGVEKGYIFSPQGIVDYVVWLRSDVATISQATGRSLNEVCRSIVETQEEIRHNPELSKLMALAK